MSKSDAVLQDAITDIYDETGDASTLTLPGGARYPAMAGVESFDVDPFDDAGDTSERAWQVNVPACGVVVVPGTIVTISAGVNRGRYTLIRKIADGHITRWQARKHG